MKDTHDDNMTNDTYKKMNNTVKQLLLQIHGTVKKRFNTTILDNQIWQTATLTKKRNNYNNNA